MKLDNKGWGTLEMVLLVAGLFIALLVAIYFISKLYGSLENSTKNKEYFELEAKLENIAATYVKDYNVVTNNGYKLTLSTLKHFKYIDEFNDENGNPCDGYVIISLMDEIPQYKGYISCKDYKSKGY